MNQASSFEPLAAQHMSDFTYTAVSHGRCDDHRSPYLQLSLRLACVASDSD